MINWFKENLQSYRITGQLPYIIAVWFPLHVISLAAIIYTAIKGSWGYLAFLPAGWAIFGGLGAAIMLHRYMSHRSIELRSWLRPILIWISCMSGQGSPIWWAALHRGYHHAHSDRDKDIHSPTKGFWHAYMGWMFSIKPDTVSLRHSTDLLRDKQLVWFHRNYNKVVWSSIIVLMAIDPLFCAWFYAIPAIICLHTDSMVNSICHTKGAGYRPFDTKDLSENIWYLGIFGWGQGWHNNHHANPRSYDFGTSISHRRYEFDPCMLWVPIISPWTETKRIFNQWRAAWAG